jgi:PAS domain S-box-containing protein
VNGDDAVRPVGELTGSDGRPASEDVPQRRWSRRQGESILHSVVEAAKAFLTASDAERTIPGVLGGLGRATEVSRVYVFQNHRLPDGRLLVDQRYEWTAPGVDPQIGNPSMRDAPLYDLGLERWERLLSEGEVVEGAVSRLPDGERAILEAQGVRSLLAVPILVEGSWWGFMGFDDCVSEREWAPPVLAGLRAAADLFGAMVTRQDLEQRLKRLAEATTEGIVVHDGVRILEANGRVAELLGDPLEAVIGRSPFEFIAPEFREMARENARQDWAEAYEVRILRSDGTSFPAEVQGRSLRLRGEDVRVVVLRDLTVRKAAEEAERGLLLERAARVAAERAERRSAFLAEATRLLVASMDTTTSLSQVARLSLQHLGQHCQFRLLVDGALRPVASAGVMGAGPEPGSLSGGPEEDPSVRELLDRVLAGETIPLAGLPPERCRAVLGWPERVADFPADTSFSCLLVPIRARDRTLGVMGIASFDGREFDEEERGTALELARRCGFAVEHVQLFDEALAAVRTRD